MIIDAIGKKRDGFVKTKSAFIQPCFESDAEISGCEVVFPDGSTQILLKIPCFLSARAAKI